MEKSSKASTPVDHINVPIVSVMPVPKEVAEDCLIFIPCDRQCGRGICYYKRDTHPVKGNAHPKGSGIVGFRCLPCRDKDGAATSHETRKANKAKGRIEIVDDE